MGDNDTESLERRGFLQATGAVGAAVALGGVAEADSASGPSEELVASYPASVAFEEAKAELPDDVSILSHDPELRIITLRVERDESLYATTSTVASIGTSSKFKSVEKNVQLHALSVGDRSGGAPADVGGSLAVDDPRLSSQYAPQLVDAPTAWEDELGSDTVTIAVVDQGVDYTHPDLAGRFGSTEGRDFVDGDDDPAPESTSENHGTHVAGIAAATTDNGTGIAGVSNSRLLSCRALGTGGSGSLDSIASAVRWAADQGADIINMSLGGGGYTDTMKNAVTYALNNGALPIVAAGNDGSEGVSYPAKYEECVAVSAVDSNDDLASFSQYGESVEVAAPGVDVLSTVPGDSYERLSGTSMACPAASGVAALGLAAAGGDLSAGQLRQRLKDTADDVGLSDDEQGAGRVNAADFVAAADGGDDGGDGGDGSGGGGGSCGDATNTASESGSLSGSGDGQVFDYALQTDGPCTVSVDLSAESGTDFDLYLTLDGRRPTRSDYDRRSYNYGSDESITVENGLSKRQELGILVRSYSGSGEFQLEIDEVGKGGGDGGDGGGGGGECGEVTDGGSTAGSLYYSRDYDQYTYAAKTPDPCQITVSTTGPDDADFELYVETGDGVERSEGPTSDETISLSDPGASEELTVYVYSRSGSGRYQLDIEEVGKR